MSAQPVQLAEKLVQLLALFHRGSLDVPEGLFARECVFRLNGVAYDESLGRPSSDPLTRLLGRGPAAYRFVAQGLRYWMPDVSVGLDDLQGRECSGLVTGLATLSGTPRGSDEPLVASADVALVTDPRGRLVEVGLRLAADVVGRLEAARRA